MGFTVKVGTGVEMAYRKEVVQNLWYWQKYKESDNFTCKLFELFQKANRSNTLKLAMSFPEEFRVLQRWMKEDGQEWLNTQINGGKRAEETE